MALVTAVVAATLIGGALYLSGQGDDDTPSASAVDYRAELLTARRAASYPVLAPQGLPDSWKATSVRFNGEYFDAWHLGFQAPDGEYVAVEQSTQKPATFIEEASQGGEETKTTEEIGGRTWTRYSGGRYDALVHQADSATTVVAGTGSYAQLTQMAKALKDS
ncbi:DUF4245 domain-containing protein [Streptomyces tendae]|uniref:DUF4245 domain-containing protein n=1 Tax=Streptomyces tendae TaxID=1932 RepID=UPI00340E5D3B